MTRILEMKRVRSRSQPDDRFARICERFDMPHLFFREIAKARKHNHQVCFLKEMQSGYVMQIFRVDLAAFRVDGVQGRGFEPVPKRQDAGQLDHRLLGAVFLVSGYERDMFARAGPFGALVDDPGRIVLRLCGCKGRRRKDERNAQDTEIGETPGGKRKKS